VRCDQPRVLDLKARRAKRVEALSQEILDEVMARLITIFE
jgi:mRNA-degrading endonuclease toxin of MazEF toxin-antitoxin module